MMVKKNPVQVKKKVKLFIYKVNPRRQTLRKLINDVGFCGKNNVVSQKEQVVSE